MLTHKRPKPEISNRGAMSHSIRKCLVIMALCEPEVGPGGADDTGLSSPCLGCETLHVDDDADLVTAG